MGRIRLLSAGSGGANIVNNNGNQGGGNSKAGAPPSVGMMLSYRAFSRANFRSMMLSNASALSNPTSSEPIIEKTFPLSFPPIFSFSDTITGVFGSPGLKLDEGDPESDTYAESDDDPKKRYTDIKRTIENL